MSAGQNSRKLQFSAIEIYNVSWYNTTHPLLQQNNSPQKGQRPHKNGLKTFNIDELLEK